MSSRLDRAIDWLRWTDLQLLPFVWRYTGCCVLLRLPQQLRNDLWISYSEVPPDLLGLLAAPSPEAAVAAGGAR